ncbi:MAG TPA: hypothetical protein VFL51_17370 [Pseudolabrys sp.]|nr:hypothetical protein [Pseudolabrys sp.]
MTQIALIGIGAGAAAALLFASVASGSLLSILLFYLSPLPLLIAALGWSHWAAMIGALGGAAALAAALGGFYFLVFLAVAGLPAWWLGYLTMLARPAPVQGEGHDALEWYPPGRLVMWAALLGAGIVIVAMPSFGIDVESFHAGLRSAIQRLVQTESEAASANLDRFIDFMVTALPPSAAILATITNVLNLWLAARIVKFSGRLRRPWPDIAAMDFPRTLALALGAAVIVSFLGGLAGIMAGVLSASLLIAYGVLGFAVLHAITRGLNSRPFVLAGTYAVVLVFGWPILALCLLGLAETVAGLRARVARKSGPPARL